jgi:hypothetical protein
VLSKYSLLLYATVPLNAKAFSIKSISLAHLAGAGSCSAPHDLLGVVGSADDYTCGTRHLRPAACSHEKAQP